VKQSPKAAITMLALAGVSLLLWLISPATATAVQVATDSDIVKLPNFNLAPNLVSAIAAVVMFAVGVFVLWRALKLNLKAPRWSVVLFGLAFATKSLVLLFSGKTMTISDLLRGSLALAVPLIFGSMAGVLSERVGIVNIAIEGQLLAGAFTSALAASVTHNLWVGLLGAMIAGAIVSWILAVFSIKYVVDQIIVGVVLNVLVIGLTSFFFSTVMQANQDIFNRPPRFEKIAIPLLSQIPVIGPMLFNQTAIVYLMYVALALVFFFMFKTRWGLRVRAVGEYPLAADTVGIKVYRTRYISVVIGGALAGLGGASFTLGSVGAFGDKMTNGAGYIALAALIFGRWNPILAALAGLLFGFAQNLQYVLTAVGSQAPSELLLMLPYALTVVAVAGLVGKVTGPASAGKPYIKS
jgi:simple sugar transport system permease protein